MKSRLSVQFVAGGCLLRAGVSIKWNRSLFHACVRKYTWQGEVEVEVVVRVYVCMLVKVKVNQGGGYEDRESRWDGISY